jgi:hypothetical protein
MTVGRIPVIEGGIQPTIFDAKADLLTATANDTPARLAVGANNTVLTADSAEATGLKWAAAASPSYTYTTYSPVVYQNGTSVAKNNGGGNSCSYVQIGKFVHGKVGVTMTATGTANQFLEIDLPVTANSGANLQGYGYLIDSSANLSYPFYCELNGTTKVVFRSTDSTANKYLGETGSPFTAALATSDQIFINFQYEAA